jgi:hypothetical protein
MQLPKDVDFDLVPACTVSALLLVVEYIKSWYQAVDGINVVKEYFVP